MVEGGQISGNSAKEVIFPRSTPVVEVLPTAVNSIRKKHLRLSIGIHPTQIEFLSLQGTVVCLEDSIFTINGTQITNNRATNGAGIVVSRSCQYVQMQPRPGGANFTASVVEHVDKPAHS